MCNVEYEEEDLTDNGRRMVYVAEFLADYCESRRRVRGCESLTHQPSSTPQIPLLPQTPH